MSTQAAASVAVYKRGAAEATKPTLESLGVHWQRTETEPAWLAPIICPFSGGYEVARGSRAEQVVRGTREFENCRAACMSYLKSGEGYQEGAAVHRAAGTLEEFHRQLGELADDYALRVCINDHWHIGDNVGNPQHKAEDPQPPGYVPMRDRVLAAGRQAPAPGVRGPGAPGSTPDPGSGPAVPTSAAESTVVHAAEGPGNNIVHLPRSRREPPTPEPELAHDEVDEHDDLYGGFGR